MRFATPSLHYSNTPFAGHNHQSTTSTLPQSRLGSLRAMPQSLINNSTISLLQKAAVFGERRHEILAGNIANVSTPDYQMRDLPVAEFQQALKDAVQQIQAPPETGRGTSSGQVDQTPPTLDELFPHKLFEAVKSPKDNLTFHDANNRSIEHQTMSLTKNSMMQNYLLELLRFQMTSLQTVISERP